MSPAASKTSPFEKLPPELVRTICHLVRDESTDEFQSADLISFALTCKAIEQCARPILWRECQIIFEQSDYQGDRILQNLQRLLWKTEHPIFNITRRVRIVLPYYTIITKKCFAADVDAALSSLVSQSQAIRHIDLNLSLIDEPLLAFGKTLNSIFACKTLDTISLLGYVGNDPIPNIPDSCTSQLKVEVIGQSLAFSLTPFTHLRWLYLVFDCRDEELRTNETPLFPPALWVTLETFVLELYGWPTQAETVMQAVAMSVQTAGRTTLTSLGLFLNLDEFNGEALLDTFLGSTSELTSLALVTPKLPTSKTLYGLARKCPGLRELTLCAYLNSGTWKWPEEAGVYAAALADFPNLRKLAFNHDDSAVSVNNLGETESFVRFAVICTEEGARLRRTFVRELASRSATLEEIAICPLEQQKSRLAVEWCDGMFVNVDFVNSGRAFFWEST